MNIILNGFHKPQYFSIVATLFEELEIQKAHIIYELEKIKLDPKIIVDYYACATLSHEYKYPELHNFLPLESKILEQMSDCEAVCLKMMERDEVFSRWSYEKRKHVYLLHIRYWNHVIQNDSIGLFLTSNIPHVVYDYIIYSLCQIYRIPTILFYQFQPGLSFIMCDWKNPTPGIDLEFKMTYDKFWGENLEALSIPDRLEKEFRNSLNPNEQSRPFYMVSNIDQKNKEVDFKKSSLEIFVKKFKSIILKLINKPIYIIILPFIVIRKLFRIFYFRFVPKIISLSDEYEDFCIKPDLTLEYIYLPLHLQPELSTSPMAGIFVDQVLIAQMLSYYLPENILIYVKEHPNQNLEFRGADFYNDFKKIDRVRFISRKFDTMQLIENSKAVATCTGTAGWEALLKMKKVFLFGSTFYQDAPGVYKILTNTDCQDAIHAVWASKDTISEYHIKIFLSLLAKYAVFADIDPDYLDRQNSSWEVNSRMILHAIRNAWNTLDRSTF